MGRSQESRLGVRAFRACLRKRRCACCAHWYAPSEGVDSSGLVSAEPDMHAIFLIPRSECTVSDSCFLLGQRTQPCELQLVVVRLALLWSRWLTHKQLSNAWS